MTSDMHTPGPWRWIDDALYGGDAGADEWSSRGQRIVETDSGYYPPHGADRLLIAAAPELLAALRDLREACTVAYQSGRIEPEPFVRAGNVIAKARP